MTNVDVDGVGYKQASAMLADANRWAAFHADRLSDALARTGAMAGDSSFAGEFAAAYDDAAATTVSAYDDVVGSLASLCRITYASFENHARAERSSILSKVVTSAEPDPMSHDLQQTLSPAPPSSLGGDASFLPGWANAILDHVEGFVWPDADVDRLRSAAGTWMTAGVELNGVCGLVGRVSFELSQERSPEIPMATEAINDLGRAMSRIASTCIALSGVCNDYADQVEIQRELILDLVHDMIRDAILIAAAGFVLGLVTGGSANAVAAWINGGKLAAYAPRLKGFLEALRLYAAGAATGLRTTTGAVVQVQLRLSPLRNMAPIRAASHTAVFDSGALLRLRSIVGNPRSFTPGSLRGMSRRDVRELLSHWRMHPSRDGAGLVFEDPMHRGRQFRVMQGYFKGNRPHALTHGDYLVVSQNGGKIKIPLEGNPLL